MKSSLYVSVICVLLGVLYSCSNGNKHNNQAVIEFDSLIQTGQIIKAEQKGRRIMEEIAPNDYVEPHMAIFNQMAQIALADERFGDAEQYALKSLEVIEVLHKKPSYEYTQTMALLGRIYYYSHALGKAVEYLQQAIELRAYEETNTTSVDLAGDFYLLSQSYAGFALYEESVFCLEKADSLYRTANTLDTAGEFEITNTLAILYSYVGREQEADQLSNQTVLLAKKWKGENSIVYAQALKTRSMVSLKGQDTLAAMRQMEQALYIMKKKSVNLYPLLDAEKFIAELYSMYGDTIRASQYYAQVMVVVDSLRPIIPEALPIASPLASYGHHLLMYKYYEEAERVLIEALSIFEHELGYGNPKIISVLKDLHTLYTSTGRHEEAQKINSKIAVIEVTPIE